MSTAEVILLSMFLAAIAAFFGLWIFTHYRVMGRVRDMLDHLREDLKS